jgi:hypothetical protein
MARCLHCEFLTPPKGQWEARWFCVFGLTVVEGEHQCHAFSREPGSDDDLGEVERGNAAGIAAKRAETAATAISFEKRVNTRPEKITPQTSLEGHSTDPSERTPA